ncbi:209_t:CDS:1, partial [Ambispora leptoticha]
LTDLIYDRHKDLGIKSLLDYAEHYTVGLEALFVQVATSEA